MKTKIKRVVSLLLASLMLFGSFQTSVFADEGGVPPAEESQADGADNENSGEENGSISEKEDVPDEPEADETPGMDFSSMRLIVGIGDEMEIIHEEPVT